MNDRLLPVDPVAEVLLLSFSRTSHDDENPLQRKENGDESIM